MKHYDSSNKKIFFMSLPIFVELFLQLLVGNVDQIMLSKYSSGSVAAIGNSNQIITLIVIIFTVASSGCLVLVTHYIGAKNDEKVNETFFAALFLIFIFSLIATLTLIFFGRRILVALNAPAEIVEDAYAYLAIVGGGLVIQGLYLVVSAVLRSYDKLKEVMFCAIIMNAVNIVGNYILIGGAGLFEGMGIVGAAISTDVSKVLGLAVAVIYLALKLPVKLRLKYLKGKFPVSAIKELLHIGVPTGGESASYNVSQIVILSFVNLFGTAVIATKVYCSMLANVAYLYSIAIAQATQIVVGYMVGAEEYGKIADRVTKTTLVCIGVSVTLTLIMYILSDSILKIFTSDTTILTLGKSVLLVEIFLEIGRSVNIVMTRCLATLGDIYFPVVTGIISQWLVATALSYLFGIVLNGGLVGIWIAMAMDEVLRGILFVIRFYHKRWLRGHGKLSIDTNLATA